MAARKTYTRPSTHKIYIQKIFGGNAKTKRPLHLLIKGTNFQIKVWEALLAIPQGKTKSYAEVARAIKSPKAVRAVGTACGKNLIPFIIPCHRVLASNGGLGGYSAGGIKRKAAILAQESIITQSLTQPE
jgi:AraC family transcriptional regulator of adaptative response/methylated-DNA-[protein]-cysteine methyltransferase